MAPLSEVLMEKYKSAEKYYAATGFSLSFGRFIIVMFGLAVFAAFAVYSLLKLLPKDFQNDPFLPAVSFFTVLGFIIGYPLNVRMSRIEQVDNAVPDSLKHMAAVLRSGGTTEAALEEVSLSDYGPLSEELGKGLRTMREGKTFDDALYEVAENSGSQLLKRVTVIILDARKAGAGLADVMNAIAEDSRDFIRIRRERKTRTTMHVAFLLITSLFLAPFIFGFAISIVKFIGAGMTTALNVEGIDFAKFDFLLKGFLAAQVACSMLAMGVIREGKPLKYVLYLGAMMFVSLTFYFLGGLMGLSLTGAG
ncbi:MAG: type II secretion system F family protein [Candidatus Micrarchaeia archaeon]|jgi:pilus assembly protein TadC